MNSIFIPLRVLIVEDSEDDAVLLLRELRRGGYEPDFLRVDTPEAMTAALENQHWDVVFADFRMPRFSAQAALALVQASGLDLPFIIISGTIGEEAAVTALKAGAHDFIVKGQLARLLPALERERRDWDVRRQRRLSEEALRAKDDELRAMTQQLWQAARLATMGELAASIAHELNNPLATVTLRIEEMLNEAAPESPQRRSLEIIESEADRMSRLVANLLQFSRRSSQQISTVDVCEEIDRTLELMSHQLRVRRITIVNECGNGTPLISADRQHLRQLFLNLFTNAGDAMPQGGTLTVRVMPEGDNMIRIEINDTGSGIAEANLVHIWEPFFTTKPEGKGTGLGLAICRRIVQEHAGTIELSSQVGVGTTFVIRLPIASDANEEYLRAG